MRHESEDLDVNGGTSPEFEPLGVSPETLTAAENYRRLFVYNLLKNIEKSLEDFHHSAVRQAQIPDTLAGKWTYAPDSLIDSYVIVYNSYNLQRFYVQNKYKI